MTLYLFNESVTFRLKKTIGSSSELMEVYVKKKSDKCQIHHSLFSNISSKVFIAKVIQ